MNNVKKFKFNITDENLKFLENLNKEFKIPKSKILNKIINSFLQKNRQNDIIDNKLHYVKKLKEEKKKEVRLFFTQNEYDIIKENAKNNNHSAVTQELRYIIFNTIYKDKFFSNVEMRQFILTKTVLNQIGRNLNQLNRELYKKNIVKINEKKLEITLNDIMQKIDILSQNLENIITKSEEKIL